MSQAFDTLYSRHVAFVRRVLARYGVPDSDLDDAAQEVFVVAHRRLPDFEGRSKLETWLYAISFRVATAMRRRRQRRRELPECEDETELEATPGLPTADRITPDGILRALDVMPEEDRELWALAEIGGLSISEISKLTGLARATIQSRLKRTRRAMDRRRRADGEHAAPKSTATSSNAATPPHELSQPPEHIDSECCVSTLEDAVITIWRGKPSPFGLERIHRAIIGVLEHHPTFSYFCVIEPSSAPPDRECRRINEELMRSMLCHAHAAAFTVERSKLFDFVVAFTNAYLFLVRNTTPSRYFRKATDAACWLASFECTRAEAARLMERVEWMKGRLDRLAPDPRSA